jgi:hypothetical protein
LAGPAHKEGWSVARNGQVIEQSQILTTHNLAALFAEAGLRRRLDGRLPLIARRCFRWICRRQSAIEARAAHTSTTSRTARTPGDS